jgi:peptide/nickel transport system permease protein
MIQFLLRRLLLGLVTLFGITLVTFFVIRLAPGGPVGVLDVGTEEGISPETYERLEKHFGLDKPVVVQYLLWLKRIVTGDFGHSFITGERVSAKVGRALWPTISVAVISLVLAFAISVPIGIYGAYRPHGIFDRIASTTLYMLYSVPSYIMGVMLVVYLGMEWDLLPFHGMRSDDHDTLSAIGKAGDYAKHYALITFCFAFGSLAYYSRFVRQNLLEVVRQDYIRTARAKGLSERRVLVRHAFTNSLIPFITLLGLTLPGILSGSVILEDLFGWPGLGRLYFQSVMTRDYPVIMALNLITAVVVLACTLLADLAYGLVDPRVKHD